MRGEGERKVGITYELARDFTLFCAEYTKSTVYVRPYETGIGMEKG